MNFVQKMDVLVWILTTWVQFKRRWRNFQWEKVLLLCALILNEYNNMATKEKLFFWPISTILWIVFCGMISSLCSTWCAVLLNLAIWNFKCNRAQLKLRKKNFCKVSQWVSGEERVNYFLVENGRVFVGHF